MSGDVTIPASAVDGWVKRGTWTIERIEIVRPRNDDGEVVGSIAVYRPKDEPSSISVTLSRTVDGAVERRTIEAPGMLQLVDPPLLMFVFPIEEGEL